MNIKIKNFQVEKNDTSKKCLLGSEMVAKENNVKINRIDTNIL
jgi:hypothetical protein